MCSWELCLDRLCWSFCDCPVILWSWSFWAKYQFWSPICQGKLSCWHYRSLNWFTPLQKLTWFNATFWVKRSSSGFGTGVWCTGEVWLSKLWECFCSWSLVFEGIETADSGIGIIIFRLGLVFLSFITILVNRVCVLFPQILYKGFWHYWVEFSHVPYIVQFQGIIVYLRMTSTVILAALSSSGSENNKLLCNLIISCHVLV